MNRTLFSVICAIVFPMAALGSNPIKVCNTVVEAPGEPRKVEMQIEILEENSQLTGFVTQTVDGKTSKIQETVKFSEDSVRPGLTGKGDFSNLNLGEKFIAHAMMLTEDPIMEGLYSSGIDLHQVRSVKVYQIGEMTKFGAAAVVEAFDSEQKALGSFLGGFLVSACK